MADPSSDPRNTGDHPRHSAALIGHERIEQRLRDAVDSGKMHHAWLICGPRGIGKATLAYRLSAFMLGARGDGSGLAINPSSQAVRWMGAQAHPDLFVLERAYDPKAKKLKTEIAVDNARQLLEFFGKTSGSGNWRVAIVDQADDLNKASANALLKMIEEPPPRALLLLVCNQPGRILRTIRSRCARLDLAPLSEDQVRQVIASKVSDEEVDAELLEAAIHHAKGSPGAALSFLNSQGAKSFLAFQKLAALNPASIVDIANRFAARNATAEDFATFTSLLSNWFAEQTREQALKGGGARMASAHVAIGELLRETDAFNLDRRHAIVRALALVDKALRAA
jgi:DNA polymerase III subunit delta'